MPAFGGLTPFPIRFGGGTPRVKTITDSLNAQRGTAYDVSQPSPVYAENTSHARAIAAVWSSNARLANQFNPSRTSDLLARWESIFAIPANATDLPEQRRARLVSKWHAATGPTQSAIDNLCAALLGDLFVAVEYTPLASAVISAEAEWPMGATPHTWYSSVGHVLVRVTQPPTVSTSEFQERLGHLMQVLNETLPAYMTFDWGVFAGNGLSGFYLDEFNLDYETFD